MAAQKTIKFIITNRTFSIVVLASVLISLFFYACNNDNGPAGPTTASPTTVQGTIFDKNSLPIAGAEISVRPSFAPAETTLSNIHGVYKFVLAWPDTGSTGTVALTATKTGYFSRSDSFVVQAGQTYSKSYTLTNRSDTTSPGPASSAVARLIFISESSTFANVKGVGRRESLILTFEARDSNDVPVDSVHRTNIVFQIIPSIGGGEKVVPETTLTSVTAGSNGRVTTTLQSGTKAGIVQVEAIVANNPVITATSPAIPIYGGLPDIGHFTIAFDKNNFPGLGLLGVQNKVTVQVGDKWGNPVPESTAIYFTTTGGIIQPAALTNELGIAQVTLSSGKSQPSNGFAWVYASTVGDSGKLVRDSARVLFSGQPIVYPSDFTFSITNGGSLVIPFRVYDKNQNPLSTGARVTVTFSGDAVSELAFTGDLDVTLGDTQDSSATFFKVIARDTVLTSPSPDKGLVMTVNVTGPNGNTMQSYVGTLRGSGTVIASNGKPASILLTGLTTNTVSVHGTGQNETSILTFTVLDRTGRAVPQDSATVFFAFVGPAGGSTISPPSVRTDAQGRVQAALTSGTIAGVVQIIASVDTGGITRLASTPVSITIAGGLPDQNHFSIAVEKLNIPGLVRFGVTDAMTVYVGDVYGNPVQPNTAVYFTTNGGYVDASAFTSTTGIASVNLRSALPNPPSGYATVTASTVDSSGHRVFNSSLVLFSGAPILTVSNPGFDLVDDSSFTLWFGVHDLNHNPLSSGTTVNVSVGGISASEVQLYGDISTTLGDALYGGYRVDTFYVSIVDKVPNSLKPGAITVTIDVAGPNGAASTTVSGVLLPTRHPKTKSLVLLNNIPRALSISGTGKPDTASFVYQIRDSLDQNIHRAGDLVTFNLTGKSGNFVPPSVLTDQNGQVQTMFNTGRIVDTVTISGQTGDIVSPTKTIFVQPGPPYAGNARLLVSMPNDTVPRVNFPQLISSSDQIAKLRIQVKDRYDNPVLQGTEIKFTANAGEIRGSFFTDAFGYATGRWYGGATKPSNGIASIEAMYSDGLTTTLLDSVSVTYSGSPVIKGGLQPNVLLPAGIDQDYSFKVSDSLGNPLAESTQVQVVKLGSAGNSIVLTGDTLRYMRDTRDTTLTRFVFHILDTNTIISTDRVLGIQLNVTGPNGIKSSVIYDTLKGAIPPPANAKILALVGISSTRLSVTGTGGVDHDTLVYELQDSSGGPVKRSGLSVTFDFTGQQGGFEPSAAITDQNGRVQTVFSSGTIAESIMVFAQMGRIASNKQLIYVQAGPPSRAYFNMSVTYPNDSLPKVNFAGMFNSSKKIGEVHLKLGDRYGNPVANNTKVAFSTNAGLLLDTAYSHNGAIKIDWFGGLPYPANGLAHIVATTFGVSNQVVGDSDDVVYSGQAKIAGGLTDGFTFRSGIDTTINYTVSDTNAYPLADGATIAVSASGSATSSLLLSGDLSVTLGDVNSKLATQYHINIRDTNTTITTDRTLQLEILVGGPNGTADKRTSAILNGIVLPPPARVAGIGLEQLQTNVLTVKDGGGVQTSLMTYQVLDSIGNPVHRDSIAIMFVGTGVPFKFTPDTVLTNALGQVQTLFHSDTVAGIVQVVAKTLTGGIQSPQTKIVIVGGKPSLKAFTFQLVRPGLTGTKVNFPGAMPVIQEIGEAQVQAGDRYGNPVAPATPIYFTTNAGVIQGSAFTDANGLAKVQWFGGNPIPPGENALVKASAMGDNSVVVAESSAVTYSGQIRINGGPQQSPPFQILGAGSMTFSFSVRDSAGNPPAEGTVVTVVPSGAAANAVVLSGDVNVLMPDTRDSAKSRFTVTVRDTTTFSTTIRSLALTISVTGPNGSAIQTTTGELLATGGGRSRLPGSIALISTSSNQIQVAGTGGTETSTMIYEIRDSLGVPVDSTYRVIFALSQPIGGAFISPDTGYCDPRTGRITSVIHSGTVSGPIQVVATVVSSSGQISSNPVRILIDAGQPNQAHFSISANPMNIPGLDVNGQTSTITVFLGDVYGNPVPQGTAVYFSSSLGIVTTSSGFTDSIGSASATLYSANPRPASGFGYVKAATIGDKGGTISDSIKILFSGAPIIDSLLTTPSNVTNFTATFRVYDRNHNPLAKDNTITIDFDGQVSLIVSRVFPAGKLPDTQDSSWTEYAANFSINILDNPLKIGPFVATITVDGSNGHAVQTFNGRVDIAAPPSTNVSEIQVASVQNSTITVNDAGDVDATPISFQIVDSLGRKIQRAGVEVAFASTGVPGTFSTDTTLTDGNGFATTSFHSGIKAGNVNIRAYVVGTSIMSAPVNIVVVGGKASQQYFTVKLTDWVAGPKAPGLNPVERLNFPGISLSPGMIGQARALVGDKYGNPVPRNTFVYFSTNAGVIVGSDTTDDFGLAVVNWENGNPIPPNGIAIIKASVLGEFGLVADSTWAVYSGPAKISGGLPSGFVLKNGTDTTITYRIADSFGNPIALGSVVNATFTGDGSNNLTMTGDVGFTTTDSRDTMSTFHTIHIKDNNTAINQIRNLTMKITVAGTSNGNAAYSADGTILGVGSSTPPNVSGIRFVSSTASQITVKNGGGTETSLLTFEIIDSVGNTLTEAGIPIIFKSNGIAGSFSADTVLTNVNGSVQVVFRSDTSAGVVEVYAQTSNGAIQSSLVRIVIVGGKPTLKYFTFIITKPDSLRNTVNFPGIVQPEQQIGTANVQLGDRYGNPVPSGTPVYFTTNAGVIQGTQATNLNGYATVNWFGGNPAPPGGIAIITASALGENGSVSVSDTVDYTGQAMIQGGPPANFQLNGGVVQTYTYTVADTNGNPLASGNTIQVSASGTAASTVLLTGDINVTTGDTRNNASTQYSLTLRDTSTFSRTARPLQITIAVTGPNGNASLTKAGSVLPVGAGDTTRSRLPGSIAFISVNPNQIQVIGTGGTETATMVFEIRDSLGIPVDSTYKVQFEFANSPGGGEFMTPTVGFSDPATGQISVLVHSGTKSGVIQLRANVITPTDTISSDIVRLLVFSGLPDQTHFTVSTELLNLPGLDISGRPDAISVIVGDKYANPVAAGTAVYFTSSIGVITTTTGYTDSIGQASVTLYTANPRSADGFGYAYASTIGGSGVTVTDSTRVLFSGPPLLNYGGSPVFSIPEGGSVSFTFTVADVHTNPISPGSKIELIATTQSQYTVSSPYILGDNQDKGPGKTVFFLTYTDVVENPPIDGGVSVYVRVTREGVASDFLIATGTVTGP